MECISFIKDYIKSDKPYRIIEIGVKYGDSIKFCLRELNVEIYIGIDPFETYADYTHDSFNNTLNQNGDKLYESLVNKYKSAPVQFIRAFSDDAHEHIQDEWADVIFIDGNHSYDYVLRDISNYFPKVKPGGIICGDDYFMRHKFNGGEYDMKMVYEAVQDYFANTHYKIEEIGLHRGFNKSWLVKKTSV